MTTVFDVGLEVMKNRKPICGECVGQGLLSGYRACLNEKSTVCSKIFRPDDQDIFDRSNKNEQIVFKDCFCSIVQNPENEWRHSRCRYATHFKF